MMMMTKMTTMTMTKTIIVLIIIMIMIMIMIMIIIIIILCPALAQNQYKKGHDTVASAVHWNLCKKYQLPCSNKWYEHQPQPVT